ncbi:actin-3, muscle-specific-like isoform X2 [Narcine bancroftii]|uniref:actin-3, muscle-specific-like isoform X2 n=1 Tax=Narcine bancroftii TaxID=1343680 RepID=UPI003831AC1B
MEREMAQTEMGARKREKSRKGEGEGEREPLAPMKDQVPIGPQMASPFTELVAIMMDNGTGYTKAGFAGDDRPQAVLPSRAVMAPRKGSAAGWSRPSSPSVVTYGIVTDWDGLESLWHHVFYEELKVNTKEHAVLLSDTPLSPVVNREKLAELLFERFCTPAMTCGLVVESGLGTSYTAPVLDGYVLPHATYRLDLAGKELTRYLGQMLEENGNRFSADETHVVDDIKVTRCYVAQEFAEEILADESQYLTDYRLPDGHLISIGNERFRCPEALFRPAAVGLSEDSLHTLVARSLQSCRPEAQPNLLANIVLAGGSSMFPGLASRLQREVDGVEQREGKPYVYAAPQRQFATWIGGSIIACMNTFQSMWLRREEYLERGPGVVHRMCV